MNQPNPKDYDSKSEYMKAVKESLDYGYCNPIKAKFAAEDEDDAEQRWNDYWDD